MKINIAEELNGVSGFLYERAIRRIARSYDPYQPLVIKGRQICSGERKHSDRFATIRSIIGSTGAKTVLDLGCAEGYFVEQAAAQCGCFALGVEADVRRLSLAQASVTLNRVQGAGFMYGDLTPDFIRTLPQFDAILFMSVLHHMMYERGLDYALEYMKGLRAKASKFVIFDMGQSNETENEWARLLPDMGANPHLWIQKFLQSAGFSKVEKLADSDAYQGAVKRALFCLTP
jgi:cyclopropane fatty-acyl-phospholipid synthase-like methyltransferase